MARSCSKEYDRKGLVLDSIEAVLVCVLPSATNQLVFYTLIFLQLTYYH